MDSRLATDIEDAQLFSVHTMVAEHRFLDSRYRATQIAQGSATRFPSFAVAFAADGAWRTDRPDPWRADRPDASCHGGEIAARIRHRRSIGSIRPEKLSTMKDGFAH
jgi:hypothetical protein